MLIEIHVIQNHSPANLNRDDLGAPKTCWFGGVLRCRISSQCIKRSIRKSKQFATLLGGIRTRRLARLIAKKAGCRETDVSKILNKCGIGDGKAKKQKNNSEEIEEDITSGDSKALIYTTNEAINKIAELLKDKPKSSSDNNITKDIAKIITEETAVPDMALSGRMLEPKKSDNIWNKTTTVEAALQVAHAISTHEARPEVDYYVATDDILGNDAGAAFFG